MISLFCTRLTLGRAQQHRVALPRPLWGFRAALKRTNVCGPVFNATCHIASDADGRQPGPAGASDGVASRPQGGQVLPPWEKQPVGDGRDELRQRLREHTPLGQEQKLELVRLKLREEEAEALEWFERCDQKGNLLGRDDAHSAWESTSKMLRVLQLDPDEFVRKHGARYGLEKQKAAAAVPAASQPGNGAAGQQPGEVPQASARQAIQQFKPRSSMAEKLQRERERLEELERYWMESFERAGKEGEEEGQLTAQGGWQNATSRLQLLNRFPLLYRALYQLDGDAWAIFLLFLLTFLCAAFVSLMLIVCVIIWRLLAW